MGYHIFHDKYKFQTPVPADGLFYLMNLLYCRFPPQAVHRESEPEDHLLIRIVIMPSVVYGCCHMPYPLQGIYNILTVHLSWKKEWFSQDPDLPADHVCSYF